MAKSKASAAASSTSEETKSNAQEINLEALLKEFEALKKQTNNILEQNKALIAENKELKNSINEPTVEVASSTAPLEKEITIVHTIQHNNGLTTFMKVGTLEIVMRNMGEKRTLTRQQFETIVGTYRHFFDMGFIALDSSEIELAETYGIDCYNPNDKTQFTAATLKGLGKASLDKVEEIYEGLSEASKKNFLNYWLNKVYEKEEGFYDKAKMSQLDRLAQTNIFAHIISAME